VYAVTCGTAKSLSTYAIIDKMASKAHSTQAQNGSAKRYDTCPLPYPDQNTDIHLSQLELFRIHIHIQVQVIKQELCILIVLKIQVQQEEAPPLLRIFIFFYNQ